jgi:hypothetical protein
MWSKGTLRSWFGLRKIPRSPVLRRRRLGVEQLEARNTPAAIIVTSALDSAPPTDPAPGTLRYAVQHANDDAANGIPDTITFDTTAMGTDTITLQQGQLELSGAGARITIDGGGSVTFDGNSASRVFQVDPPVVIDLMGLTIQHGSASSGSSGGGILNDGNLTLSYSTVSDNAADYSGGGIANGGTLTVVDSTLAGNSTGNGGDGGAIFNGNNATAILTNSTLYNNTAEYVGGGLFNYGLAQLTDCTVYDNSAAGATGGGGGIFSEPFQGTGVGGTLRLGNSIVAGNSGNDPDIYDAIPVASAISYNLIGNGNGLSGISNGENHNMIGSGRDPGLGTPGYYGGMTRTVPLLFGSPAINNGDPTHTTPDQRGDPRSGAVDVGAYQTEPPAALFVSAPAKAGAGVGFTVTITVEDQNGDTVTNVPNVIANLTSSDGQPVSPSKITLVHGAGTATVTLDSTATLDTLTAEVTLSGVQVSGTSDNIVIGGGGSGGSGGGGGGGMSFAPPPPARPAGRPITAQFVTVKVGKKKMSRLMVEVFFADTGALKKVFLSPFQRPAYRNIQVSVRDSNGNGVPDQVVVTARRGHRTVSAVFPS